MGQLLFIPYSSAGAAPTPSAVLDLYLSGANGDDANDGLTPATAKATPEGVFALFPAELSGPLVVHVGAAGVVGADVAYAWSSMPTPAQLNETARIWIYGDGAGQAGEDGFEEIVTGACAAGTDAQQVTLAVPVVENVYQHFTLEMTSGPANGYRRTVQQNTTTQIWPCRQFDDIDGATGAGTTPVNGNTFRILRPSVIFADIDTLEGQTGFLGAAGRGDGFASLFLVNVSFAATTSSAEVNGCSIYLAGVEFRGATFPSFVSCSGSIGWWDNLSVGILGITPLALPRSAHILQAKAEWFEDIGLVAATARLSEWRGWGVACSDIVAAGDDTDAMSFYGCQLAAIGTFGHVISSACPQLGLGGFFWTGFRCTAGTYTVGVPQNTTTTNGIVLRKTMRIEFGSTFVVYAQSSITYATNFACEVSGNSTCLLNANVTLTRTSGSGLIAVNVFDHSAFSAFRGLVSSGGGLRAYMNSQFYDMYDVTITNAVGGIQLINSSSYTSQYGRTISLTCSGEPIGVYHASVMEITDTVSILDGTNIRVESEGTFIGNKALTASISGSLLVRSGGRILQRAGTLSITSTATTALVATDADLSLVAATFVGVVTAVSLTNTRCTASAGVTATGVVTLTGSRLYVGGTFSSTTNVSMDESQLQCLVSILVTGILTLTNNSVCIAQAATITGYVSLASSLMLHTGAFTVVTGSPNSCIVLTKGSSWQQGGALSATATSGDGMALDSVSSASFSGASVVLTGAGGGSGLSVRGGSKAWFASAPTGVTGTAGADLVVGGNAAVANGTLAAANNFITDTDTTGLLGGGNVIGRAA